jgi:hypothetical protein
VGWVRDHLRGCPVCGPLIVGRYVDAIPDGVTLYAHRIERADFGTLQRRLARYRAAGRPGDYQRVALSERRLVVLNDAGIGNPITRDQWREILLAADSEDGNFSASKAWRPERPANRADNVGWVDVGVMTATIEEVVEVAEALAIPVRRDGDSWKFGPCSEVQEAALLGAAQIVTKRRYWRMQRRGSSDGRLADMSTASRRARARAA